MSLYVAGLLQKFGTSISCTATLRRGIWASFTSSLDLWYGRSTPRPKSVLGGWVGSNFLNVINPIDWNCASKGPETKKPNCTLSEWKCVALPRIVASILENNPNYRWNLDAPKSASSMTMGLIGFRVGELIKIWVQKACGLFSMPFYNTFSSTSCSNLFF